MSKKCLYKDRSSLLRGIHLTIFAIFLIYKLRTLEILNCCLLFAIFTHKVNPSLQGILSSGGSKHYGKTSFVEHRTFLHLYHSFHRLWIFLFMMFQVSMYHGFCLHFCLPFRFSQILLCYS